MNSPAAYSTLVQAVKSSYMELLSIKQCFASFPQGVLILSFTKMANWKPMESVASVTLQARLMVNVSNGTPMKVAWADLPDAQQLLAV